MATGCACGPRRGRDLQRVAGLALRFQLSQQAKVITVAGLQGSNKHDVNGAYRQTAEVHNGRSVYDKIGDSTLCMRFTTGNKWVVSNVTDKEKNTTSRCVAVVLEQ